jgi:enamine deaminase RidA (YjgF/YER057c/UK114 family)
MIEYDVHTRLVELAIPLASVSSPAAAYVMSTQCGNAIHLSGHIAKKDGRVWVGKLGDTLTTDDGYLAARATAIDLLATLHAHTGNLNRVKRIVKLMGLVNSTPDFTEQHLVINGASDLFADLFGDKGKHARCVFGVAQIPMGACIEIEITVEVI